MRPRRANRDEARVADETAEREASDYAQAVFTQHKYGPRAAARIPWSTAAVTTPDEQANALATLTPLTEWRTAPRPVPSPTPIEIVPAIEMSPPVVMPTVDVAPVVEVPLAVEAVAAVEVALVVEVSPSVEVPPTIVAEPVVDELVVETPDPEPSNLVEIHAVPTSNPAPSPVGAEPRTSDRTLLSVALGVGGVAAATIFSRRRRR